MPAEMPAEMLAVHSAVLGPLTLDADTLYTFPDGLVGFDAYRRFALLDAGRPGLWWLQSVDVASLVFLLADPFRHAAGYDADVPDADIAALGPADPAALLVLAVVTLPTAGAAEATANLRAPVVFHTGTRTARQIVLADDRWRVAEPIRLAAEE